VRSVARGNDDRNSEASQGKTICVALSSVWQCVFRTGMIYHSMPDLTRILSSIEQGDTEAAAQLLPLVYDELRKLAALKMAQEKPGQTLQATALVHEAYLRVVGTEKVQSWDSRRHFFAAAAEAMRRILIDNARHKRSEKGGGGLKRHDLDDVELTLGAPADGLLELDDALIKLESENREAADLVKLRLFAGLTVDEAADSLGISRRTGFRLWTYARAFLQAELAEFNHGSHG
jgi:RNA polymerase sigma factor (TIGR02999 family)